VLRRELANVIARLSKRHVQIASTAVIINVRQLRPGCQDRTAGDKTIHRLCMAYNRVAVKHYNKSNPYPSLSITYIFIFCIGLACMAVAGYFLIQGLSQFSGSGGAKNMLIIGGVLFQITESLCFIAASALTYHSLRWRYILFSLGMVLFSFSIGVMTLAQKTALQTGEAQAQANDEKREHIRSQIASLQQVIDSYRLNAEKQSKSIYKDSRALGQDSINRATELEERKMQLSEELYTLNTARRQTAADFFQRLEEISGLPAKSTEFYFLVLRSLLLELSGIILMSFGANLRAYNKLVRDSGAQADLVTNKPLLKKVFSTITPASPKTPKPLETQKAKPLVTNTAPVTKPVQFSLLVESAPAEQPTTSVTKDQRSTDNDKTDETDNPEQSNPKESQITTSNVTGHQLNFLVTMVMDLYEQRLLQELNPIAIKDSLSRYCSQKVSHDTAGILSKMINTRLDETC
jgi:hypothetical protein